MTALHAKLADSQLWVAKVDECDMRTMLVCLKKNVNYLAVKDGANYQVILDVKSNNWGAKVIASGKAIELLEKGILQKKISHISHRWQVLLGRPCELGSF